MKGTIFKINTERRMVGVQTENGYSIFELMSEENVNVGDIIQWNDDTPLGDTPLQNLTQQCTVNVYFQNHNVALMHLNSQLLF